MYIFISYPRSIKDKAEIIDSFFAAGKYTYEIFLDKESISPSDVWRQKISETIKKSDIYIVLIDKNKVNDGGYFEVEIEEIQHERRKNLNKEIIPVLFNSKDPKEAPIFFQNFNIIIADEKNNQWVSKIKRNIEEIEEKNKETLLEKFFKRTNKKLVFLFFITICSSSFVFVNHILNNDKGNLECKKILSRKSFSLASSYALPSNQTYNNEYMYLVSSTEGQTNVASEKCEDHGDGSYSLTTDEFTSQKIYLKNMNSKSPLYVGTSTNRHPSILLFNKNGLYKRKFYIPIPSNVTAICDNKEEVDAIFGEGKCNEIMDYYKEKSVSIHAEIKGKNDEGKECAAFFIERNGSSYINSDCGSYERKMKG